MSAVAERARLPDKALVEDIAVGNVLAAGGAATVSRMACLHAGYPVSSAIFPLFAALIGGIYQSLAIAPS